MTNNFIYGRADPRTGEVLYIGKTYVGMSRPRMHAWPHVPRRDKTYKGNWLRVLADLKLKYEIKVLEEVEKHELGEDEQWWIRWGRLRGWSLTNLTDGGEGLGGHIFTEDHKAKVGAAHRGKTLSAEARAKISVSMQGRIVSIEECEKRRLRATGRKHSIETCRKISAIHKGKTVSPEARQKVSEKNSVAIVDETTGLRYASAVHAADALNLHPSPVSKVLRGRHKTAGGRTFRYAGAP